MTSRNYNMDEIDKYLEQVQEQHEIYEFISKGIYPSRLNQKYPFKYIPPLDEEATYYTECKINTGSEYSKRNEIYDDFDNIKQLLCKIENEIQYNEMDKEYMMIEYVDNTTSINIDNIGNEDCPICIERINNRNYIVPNCGHKICINCFVKNLTLNYDNPCGNKCSICREHIITIDN